MNVPRTPDYDTNGVSTRRVEINGPLCHQKLAESMVSSKAWHGSAISVHLVPDRTRANLEFASVP